MVKTHILLKKGLVIGILVLLAVSSIMPITGSIILKKQVSTDNKVLYILGNTRGNISYVGGSGYGNYSKIQYAIDNASDGDTVFVYDDSSPYEESIVVDKSINLIGEDRNTTFINGSTWGKGIVYINADWTNFSGFTIQNIYDYETGIYLNSNYSTITGNNIVDFNYFYTSFYMFGIYLNILITIQSLVIKYQFSLGVWIVRLLVSFSSIPTIISS